MLATASCNWNKVEMLVMLLKKVSHSERGLPLGGTHILQTMRRIENEGWGPDEIMGENSLVFQCVCVYTCHVHAHIKVC